MDSAPQSIADRMGANKEMADQDAHATQEQIVVIQSVAQRVTGLQKLPRKRSEKRVNPLTAVKCWPILQLSRNNSLHTFRSRRAYDEQVD